MTSIVTFYSYKGGVGRSMALANIAVLLARRGLKVLAVDWDLEAPGLERYFGYFDIKPGGPGLLRLFMEARDGRPPDYSEFTSSIDCDTTHPITLLASGREQDEAYSRNLESFDWEAFFVQGGGSFVEELRHRWRHEFDIVLVDSRTGLSDTGGICTIQVPDIVVAMFTANYQSLYGVRDVMRLAQKARQSLAYDRMPLSVLPLPARWGLQEFQETQVWLDRVTEAMQEFYEDWLPRNLPVREVVERVKVPQADYFGFGEKLAVVEQGTSDPAGMGFMYDKVASFLASDFKDVGALVGVDVPSDAQPTTEPGSTTPSAGPARKLDYLHDVFVSHDRSMPEFVLDFVHQLRDELTLLRGEPAQIFVDVGEIWTAKSWEEQTEESLLRSKVLLAMLTPRYSESPLCKKEYLTFAQRARRSQSALLVPVLVRGEDFPAWLHEFQWVDLRKFPSQRTPPSRRPAALQREIARLAEALSAGIAEAPPYDPKWAASPLIPDPEVRLWPVDFTLVTGDRERHPDLGPTVNMTCGLSNEGRKPVELIRLEMAVTQAGESVYHLAWHLFYDAVGMKHVKARQSERITIAGKSVWKRGVQFRDSRADTSNIWPAGSYEFELLGWVDRRPGQAPPNLKTKFRSEVDPFIEREMRRWREASAKDWDELGDPDRAVGFPLLVTDIRADK
jgi:MinD-like ATPase involved in chromosome partitioning or flagellar assembly